MVSSGFRTAVGNACFLDSEAGSSCTVRMPDGITISPEGEGEVLHMELQGGLDGGTMTGAPTLLVFQCAVRY